MTVDPHLPDEEPEAESITVGWELTDERHGFCSWCGWKGHTAAMCPHRPEAA